MTDQASLLERPAGLEPFRPIQYLGSKARILDAIGEALDRVDPARGGAVDLFSGSGVVSAHLARSRAVVAVDVQEYARVLAAALIAPIRLDRAAIEALVEDARGRAGAAELTLRPLIELESAAITALADGEPAPFAEVVEGGSLAGHEFGESPERLRPALDRARESLGASELPSTLTRVYGGVYFSYPQAIALDCLLAVVHGMPPGPRRDTCLAAALGAASESVTSVGSHFAQPLRARDRAGNPKPGALRTAALRRQRDVFALFAERLRRYAALPGAEHPARALRQDYRAFLASYAGETGVLYADPPYTREHYSRFYHVLETMALGDSPAISTVNLGGRTSLSRGLYREDRHQSPFCIHSQAPQAFRDLFAGARALDAPLVLSYSPSGAGTAARPKPRLMTVSDLVDLAREQFDRVEVSSLGRFRHSKFNARELNGESHEEAEVLLLCEQR